MIDQPANSVYNFGIVRTQQLKSGVPFERLFVK